MLSEPVAVYTALYGGYDRLPTPVEQDIDVDFICFTDDPSLQAPGWEVRVDPPRAEHPRMAAKYHKMHAGEVLPEHRWAIWVDANVLVDDPSFAREAVAVARRAGAGVTTFRHPERDCILDEARAAAALPKCQGVPVVEQARAYLDEGYPRHGGLFGCRSLIWDTTDAAAAELGRAWLAECETWTYRDQISFPVVARRLGVVPGVVPHHLFRHTVREGLACWLGRRRLARPLLDRLSSAAGPASSAHDVHPIARKRPIIGNPWFDVVPHRLET